MGDAMILLGFVCTVTQFSTALVVVVVDDGGDGGGGGGGVCVYVCVCV